MQTTQWMCCSMVALLGPTRSRWNYSPHCAQWMDGAVGVLKRVARSVVPSNVLD